MKSRLLIGFGIGCFVVLGILMWQMNRPARLSFDKVPVTAAFETDVRPVALKIDTLSINLPVIPAEISSTQWETTTKGVSFLKTSALPGEVGNSVMYGHNWPNLLGKITSIKNGDTIQVLLSSGETRIFKVVLTQEVFPDQTSVLGNTEDVRLTIYTCVGFLDSKRFVVVAIRQ
jgi:sortase (surface protein transpeptidase)